MATTRKDLKVGVKGPSPGPLRSSVTLRGPGGRLRRVVDTTWVPAGSGLMRLRTDSYKMSTKISKGQQKVFERRGISLKRNFRPYSHKVSGIGRYGPIRGSEMAHKVETGRVPKPVLSRAAKGKLPKGSKDYARYFR